MPPLTPDDLKTAAYPTAAHPCDIVMKGGVTSGVVYPSAICRLAKDFVLHNIGGTSAGAIAAALAAAAEFSRRKGGNGYNQLAALPDFLGSGNNLQDLFQPNVATQPLFRVFLALLSPQPLASRLRNAAVTALRWYWRSWLPWVAGALLLSIPLALALAGTWQVFYLAAFVFTAAVIAAGAGIAWGLWTTLRIDVPDNYYGMCTGFSQLPGMPPPLTSWLAATIDAYAGVTRPLTFGDLHGAPPGNDGITPVPFTPTGNAVYDELAERASRAISLEMVTTNTTIGRPYRLPFSPLEDFVYYYDPSELGAFFPAPVIAHMKAHQPPAWPAKTYTGTDGITHDIIPLPDPEHFPVIVAARMSLSFPILFSAIPLYAVRKPGMATPAEEVTKCWFSDGGISSNIPVHFFDNPLPRWPTFALNLRGVAKPPAVAMATENIPDTSALDDRGAGRLPQFLSAILDSMQNWVDNTQMRLPGYMERVVEVQLDETEGGLHLTMSEETRKKLAGYGLEAGDILATAFLPSAIPKPRWSEHRWLRYRNTFASLSEWLWHYAPGYAHAIPPDAPYATLAAAPPPGVAYSGYPWTSAAQQAASATMAATLSGLATDVIAIPPDENMTKDAPAPGPELRQKPRI